MKKKFIMLLILLTLFIPVSAKAFDLNLFQVLDGCDAVGSELNTWLKNAFKFVEFAGVGLAIVLTAVDFIQVIGGSKDDDLKNAFSRTVKRLIAVVLLLLTSVFVGWIIDIVAPVSDVNIPDCVEGV